jgi:hypothetical protein
MSSENAVAGIDSLTASIPHYADKFVEMTRDTEEMAKELEDRMKYLEDGYDYLSQVSAQVPAAIQEMSENYKTHALGAANMHVLDASEKENLSEQKSHLEHLKNELKSISQERVIVEVFTRATITRAKAHHTKMGVDNEPSFLSSERSQRASYDKRSHALARSGYPDKAARGEGAATKSLLGTERPPSFGQGAGRSSDNYNMQSGYDVNAPIDVPSYRGSHGHSHGHFDSIGSEVGEGGGASDSGDDRRRSKRGSGSVTVRPTNGNIMVPSMRQGSLPEELRNLHVTPTMDPQERIAQTMERRERKSAQKAMGSVQKLVAPVAKALKQELRQNQKEMAALRTDMHNSKRQAHAENLAQRRVIRGLANTFETRLAQQQDSLKEEMESVVGGAFDRLTSTLQDLKGQQGEGEEDAEESSEEEEEDVPRRRSPRAASPRSTGKQQQHHHQEASTHTKKKSSKKAATKSQTRYDINGHRIAHKTQKVKKASYSRYDINGHLVKHGEEEEEEKEEEETQAKPTPGRAAPAAASARSTPMQQSPRSLTPRTVASATDTAISPATDTGGAWREQHEDDDEYFYDPNTGNRYRILQPSVPVGGGSSQPASPMPGGGGGGDAMSVMSGVTHGTQGGGGRSRAFYSQMAVGRPLDPPPKTESERREDQALQRVKEAAARRAQELGGHQPVCRKEYALVSGPAGVQWQAVQVPVDPYMHPDVSHYRQSSGGEGAVGTIDAILPKGTAQEYQDPRQAGLDALSHGFDRLEEDDNEDEEADWEGHGSSRGLRRMRVMDEHAKERALTAVLGVVGGGITSSIGPVLIAGAGQGNTPAGGGGRYQGPRATALTVLPDEQKEGEDEEEREAQWAERSKIALPGSAFPALPQRPAVPEPALNEPLVVQSASKNPNTAATISHVTPGAEVDSDPSKSPASKHAHIYDYRSAVRVEGAGRESDREDKKEKEEEVVADIVVEASAIAEPEPLSEPAMPSLDAPAAEEELIEEIEEVEPETPVKEEEEEVREPVREPVALNSALGKKLQQVVPALQPASAPASAAQQQQPDVVQPQQPSPVEFASALVEALKAAAASVAPPAPVVVAPVAPAPPVDVTPEPRGLELEALMRQGVEQGVQAGVKQALSALKKREQMRAQHQEDRDTLRARDGGALAGRGGASEATTPGGSGAGWKNASPSPERKGGNHSGAGDNNDDDSALVDVKEEQEQSERRTRLLRANRAPSSAAGGDKAKAKKPHSRLLETYRSQRAPSSSARPVASAAATYTEDSSVSVRGGRGEFMPLVSGMLGSRATKAAAALSFSWGSDDLNTLNTSSMGDHIPPGDSPARKQHDYHPRAPGSSSSLAARVGEVTGPGVTLAPSVVAQLARKDGSSGSRVANSLDSDEWVSVGESDGARDESGSFFEAPADSSDVAADVDTSVEGLELLE